MPLLVGPQGSIPHKVFLPSSIHNLAINYGMFSNYLGHFLQENSHQDLSKIAQSDHAGLNMKFRKQPKRPTTISLLNIRPSFPVNHSIGKTSTNYRKLFTFFNERTGHLIVNLPQT